MITANMTSVKEKPRRIGDWRLAMDDRSARPGAGAACGASNRKSQIENRKSIFIRL
ncbi:hypothetical protein [Fontivita pretiosa]|uniref:hypothetical protein n=1 Tax=Fontivita pretiosa TaxID=2989684 RepID=UPI003D17179F